MNRKVKIGVVGYGRMGRGFVNAMQADCRYEICALCDANEATRSLAGISLPGTAVYENTDTMFADAKRLGLDAVGLFRQANGKVAAAQCPQGADELASINEVARGLDIQLNSPCGFTPPPRLIQRSPPAAKRHISKRSGLCFLKMRNPSNS